jgi:Fe-S cluster assembly protein SufD
MSAVLRQGAAGFLSRYEGLRARLPGDRATREAAASSFAAGGLPGVRDEAWKYTSLRALADAGFNEALTPLADATALPQLVAAIAAPRLVFVAGRYRPDLSALPQGVACTSFAADPGFGRLARPAEHPMVALNTMLAEDGAHIAVPAGQDGGVLLLVSLGAGAPAHPIAFHPRHAVHLAAGARLTLIEIAMGEGVYLHNPVSEILVGEGATLEHVRLQDESGEAFALATVYADIAAGGTYDSFSLTIGSRLARSEIHARLTGAGATAHLNAAQMLHDRQHGDFTTVVSHDAPSCASRQTVKNVLDGHARGVFQGRIEVARGAQKTDGYQMNQALLLSPDAEIDSKPELEIFADDVKCSHGATVGELDEEQVFYLRSRGVPDAQARAMLVRAFLAEALAGVANDTARGVLDTALEKVWERRAA